MGFKLKRLKKQCKEFGTRFNRINQSRIRIINTS